MKKYAIVGTGDRAAAFGKPMADTFPNEVELVGVFDINPLRANKFAQEHGGVPVYADFDTMLVQSGAEFYVIATPDYSHHEYIIRTMEAGFDVVTEKPMTTDSDKCKAILEAERRTGRHITVAFNCRYMPYMAQLKKIIEEGTIGQLISIDFNWYLDTIHGAQYFRRWHRHMNQSGGLLVHKSTHHFDLVNWWLDDQPMQVNAMGTRQYFGSVREQRGERCLTCDFKKSCEHYIDIQANKYIREHYYDNEKEDGYIRDKCVFGDDIDIYDTMSVQVQYQRGALLNYSLVAHSPYKNWTATFNGTEGRMEAGEYFRGPRAEEPMHHIQIYNRAGEVISRQTKKATGSHGGGDYRLQQMICTQSKDELRQRAGSMSGAMSLLIGVAANRSIVEGKRITIQDLLD